MKQYNLLLVESHKVLRQSAKSLILDSFGNEISIDEVCNGKEALKHVATTPPDGILMSVGLPEMRGIKVTEEMRSQNYQGHIFLWSIYDYSVKELQDIGATDFLKKANASTELPALLRKYI